MRAARRSGNEINADAPGRPLSDLLAMVTDQDIDRLMKRCQIGFGGRNALDQAHSCLADCYATLGRLQSERKKLGMALLFLVEIYEQGQEPMPSRPDWLREALGIYRAFSADG